MEKGAGEYLPRSEAVHLLSPRFLTVKSPWYLSIASLGPRF